MFVCQLQNESASLLSFHQDSRHSKYNFNISGAPKEAAGTVPRWHKKRVATTEEIDFDGVIQNFAHKKVEKSFVLVCNSHL